MVDLNTTDIDHFITSRSWDCVACWESWWFLLFNTLLAFLSSISVLWCGVDSLLWYATLVIDWVFVLIAREWDCTSSSSLAHSYYQRHLKVISGIAQTIFQSKSKWVLQFEIPKVLLWQSLYQMTVITFLLPKAELCVACLDQDSLYFANLFLALCFLRTGCSFWSPSELRVPFDWMCCWRLGGSGGNMNSVSNCCKWFYMYGYIVFCFLGGLETWQLQWAKYSSLLSLVQKTSGWRCTNPVG